MTGPGYLQPSALHSNIYTCWLLSKSDIVYKASDSNVALGTLLLALACRKGEDELTGLATCNLDVGVAAEV